MKCVGQLAAVSAIALAAAGGTFLVKGPPSRVVACDPATLKPGEVCIQQIPANEDILWVDARSRADWAKNGVKESILWNLDPAEDMQAFEAEAAVKIGIHPKVVVYCYDENCGISHQVADQIRKLDLGAEVLVLRGGWSALKNAGRVKDSSPKI